MVMSEDSDMVEKESEVINEDRSKEKERVSDKEKELAAEASSAFSNRDFTGCFSALEKLEVLRPTDVVLAHNKIVVQCKNSEAGVGHPVSLSEVVQQLEGLTKTQGISLASNRTEDEAECSVLVYNMAVARFQQRHMLQASQLASRLLPLSPSFPSTFARKVLFLHCELSLALHQPELAMVHAVKLEELLGDMSADQTEGLNLEQGRVLVLKARCSVMARMTKTLKKELKSVSLPGTLGQTCEFVRSHIEALHGNHRKSIKMLNSVAQTAGNRVFPHYFNNLGCLHQIMRKPNLAVFYFKSALERLEKETEASQPSQSNSWLTQSQVLYNIGISLLHARRPGVAFDILLEVVGAHYLDPHVWFHLAECCILAHQPDNHNQGRAREVSQSGAGAGLSYKLVASNPPQPPVVNSNTPGAAPVLSLDFAYVCLKNAESLLPNGGSGADGVFCEGIGYIGNPVTWVEVEQLRVAIITCKAYTALALGDYVPAHVYAEEILSQQKPPPGCYKLLAHLYAAESLILQDRLSEALAHLDPDLVSVESWEVGQPLAQGWYPDTADIAKQTVQYNLAVGFALREEWEKATSLIGQLYREGQDVAVQVLLLVLYLSLKQGQVDKARRIVRERCPATTRPPDS